VKAAYMDVGPQRKQDAGSRGDAASMTSNFARMTPFTKGFFAAGKTAMCSLAILSVSDSFHSPTDSAGQAAQQLS